MRDTYIFFTLGSLFRFKSMRRNKEKDLFSQTSVIEIRSVFFDYRVHPEETVRFSCK